MTSHAPDPVLPPGTIERYLTPARCDWSYRIYPSIRTHRFNEMEFSLPAEAAPEAFLEIRRLMRTRFREVTWVVEYRGVAEENLFLSPSFGRPSVTISIHLEAEHDCTPFFQAAQPIFLAFGGRPHWGKVHYCTSNQLARLYPQWDNFLAARQNLDPDGVFLNEYLRKLLT